MLFYGYVADPFYIAFYIAYEGEDVHGGKPPRPEKDMTRQLIIDAILLLDIIFKCLTTFQSKDSVWETSLLVLFKNYAIKGSMLTDCLGTIPTLLTN